MRRCINAEEFVYQAVESGELEIDEQGNIWRVGRRQGDRWSHKHRVLACARVRAEHPTGKGYLQVRLMVDGKRISACAHRLVYLHVHGPIPDGLTVNHKDGAKSNNAPSNLELATDSEQQLHAVHVLGHGRSAHQNGEANLRSKLTSEDVTEIRRRRGAGEPLAPIAEDFGVVIQTISKIALGRSWAVRA